MKDKFVKAFITTAETFAKLSSAKRLQVGSIIVNEDGRILSVGYNGTPTGWDNECERVEYEMPDVLDFRQEPFTKLITKDEVIHAESNALLKCAKDGQSTKGAIMFVTHEPCMNCAKLIHQAGIAKVYYKHAYISSNNASKYIDGISFLKKCNIEVIKLDEENTVQLS